jgi:pimeloyl-ACP methyl ester carboxylesterase
MRHQSQALDRWAFEWRGRRIAWSRAGSGPALVLCHGTPCSSASWAIPGSPLALVSEAGHLLHLDRPVDLMAQPSHWLDRAASAQTERERVAD